MSAPTVREIADLILSPDEQAELTDLRLRKAWGSPRFRELDRKAAQRGSYVWRQADVWGRDLDDEAVSSLPPDTAQVDYLADRTVDDAFQREDQ